VRRLARTAFASSVALGLLAPARASAHDPLEITTDAHVDVSGFNVHTTLSLDTAARICLTGAPPGRRLAVPDFSQFRPQFERCARDFYAVDSGGKRLTLLSLELSLSPEDDLEIRAVYARPSASPLSFEALGLKGLPQAAGIVLTVTGRRSFLGQKLLRPDDARFERQITAEGEDVATPPLPPPDSPVQRDGAYRLVLALFLTLLVSAGAFLAWRRRR
jgi:hypothetical protein